MSVLTMEATVSAFSSRFTVPRVGRERSTQLVPRHQKGTQLGNLQRGCSDSRLATRRKQLIPPRQFGQSAPDRTAVRSVSSPKCTATERPCKSDNSLSRRTILALALTLSPGLTLVTESAYAASVRDLTIRGMDRFRQGDVIGSVSDFDAVIDLAPRQTPFLWQRGLSLYYADRFEDAAEQFRTDVAVNPNDTEEAVWTYLSEAQVKGPEYAQKNILQVGRDSRRVMRQVYEVYKGNAPLSELENIATSAGGGDQFYALLYIALWHEAHQDAELARETMQAAVQSPYGRKSGDYMASLAAVHIKTRGWQ